MQGQKGTMRFKQVQLELFKRKKYILVHFKFRGKSSKHFFSNLFILEHSNFLEYYLKQLTLVHLSKCYNPLFNFSSNRER